MLWPEIELCPLLAKLLQNNLNNFSLFGAIFGSSKKYSEVSRQFLREVKVCVGPTSLGDRPTFFFSLLSYKFVLCVPLYSENDSFL
jgi:hypothetical protein